MISLTRRPLTFIKCSQRLFRCSSSKSEQPQPFSAMPGPQGTLSNIIEYTYNGGIENILETFRKRFERYGPIYREKMFGEWIVNIADPKAIEKVLRAEQIFAKRPGFEPLEKCAREAGRQIAILGNDYESWYAERSVLSKKVLRTKEVNQFFPSFNEVSNAVVTRFRDQNDGVVENLESELQHWAGESVSTFLFGQKLGFYSSPPNPLAAKFTNLSLDLLNNLGKLLANPPLYKYFDTPTYKNLRRILGEIFGGHCFDLVKDAIDSTTEGGWKTQDAKVLGSEAIPLIQYLYNTEKFTLDLLEDLSVAFVLAGIDTTSTTALWSIYLLSKNPDAQEKLYQELVSVLGTDGEISEKNIGRLSYLKAYLKESMRVCPTSLVLPRKLDYDFEVLGYDIPAGVKIMMQTYLLSRSEKYYGSNAKDFCPERLLRTSRGTHEASTEKFQAFTHLPFGYGVRMCIGRRIAEAELYSLLSKLVMNFRMELVGEQDLGPLFTLLLRPDKPVQVKFIPK